MSLIEWGALGELVGGVAIIVSLLYVGAQIKHNTKAERASASQAFIDIHAQIVFHISGDKEFRDIYWRGLGGLSALQGSETAAFGAWAIQTFSGLGDFLFPMEGGYVRGRIMGRMAKTIRRPFRISRDSGILGYPTPSIQRGVLRTCR